ncbi:hypothetical protein ABT061_15860 [Streptosporangium sp. NPDC002544]|uniref:hypothetical protein n=1 Tax=Streptosporangium sp. NPDC002544 TaxID=3154538 RepID=UPI003322AECA
MTAVYGSLVTPGGDRPSGASVLISLVDGVGRSALGFTAAAEVLGQVSAIVDVDGSWTAGLTPNGEVTAAVGPTLYQVTERAAGSSGSYFISVPTSPDPVWVGDLRVTLPGSAAEELVGYVPLAGGTMTGELVLEDGSPAASEQYVADNGGGGGGGTPSGTVVSGTSYGQAAAAGASGTYSRGDHTHGTPALPAPGAIGAATSGHTHGGVYDPAGTAASAVAAHEADTTNVHGIIDTSTLETSSGAAAKVSAHAVASDPHGDRAYADAGDAARLAKASNLSDLPNASTARTNLGLGGAAVLAVGASTGTVAAGDDSRITGAQQRSTLTTKGDLYVATGVGAVARVGVGADDQVLTADSGQAAGVRWADPPAGGGSDHPAFPLSGYGLLAASGDPAGFLANSNATNNSIFMARVWIPAGVVVTSLWAAVRTGGTYSPTGTPNQLALYDASGNQVAITADDPTLWSAAGWRGNALPSSVPAQGAGRWTYIGLIVGGYTVGLPYPTGVDDASATWFSGGVGSTPRRAMYASGSSLPASFSPSSYGTPTTYLSLVGVS